MQPAIRQYLSQQRVRPAAGVLVCPSRFSDQTVSDTDTLWHQLVRHGSMTISLYVCEPHSVCIGPHWVRYKIDAMKRSALSERSE